MVLKLRKRDRDTLEGILDKLRRGHEFLMRDTVLVCVKQDTATTSLHYVNGRDDVCYSMNKQIGSELCLLHAGIDDLSRALSELYLGNKPPTKGA